MKRIFALLLCLLLLSGCSDASGNHQPVSDDSSAAEASSPVTVSTPWNKAPVSHDSSVAEAPLLSPTGSTPDSTKPILDYELLNAWDLLDTAPLQIEGSWSYFCANVQTAEGHQTILARDNPKGDIEVLLTLPISGTYIDYIENSLQQSGNQQLYFTAPTEIIGQNELYSFRLSDSRMTKLLPAPCSNMIVPADPPNTLSGFGWLVYGSNAMGIDLAAGLTVPGSNLENCLDGHFFYGIGAGFDKKYTVLEAVEHDVLTLKTIQYDSTSSAPEQVTQLYYSISSQQYSTEPSSNFAPPYN